MSPCDTSHPSAACIHSINSSIFDDIQNDAVERRNVSVNLCTKPYDDQDRFTNHEGHVWEINFSNSSESNNMEGISIIWCAAFVCYSIDI